MTLILAADPSYKTGLVTIETHPTPQLNLAWFVNCAKRKQETRSNYERQKAISDSFRFRLTKDGMKWGVSIFAIEATVSKRGIHQGGHFSGPKIIGRLEAVAEIHGLQVVEVSPIQAKAAFGLPKSAAKHQMIAAATTIVRGYRDKMKDASRDEREAIADACAIAIAGSIKYDAARLAAEAEETK